MILDYFTNIKQNSRKRNVSLNVLEKLFSIILFSFDRYSKYECLKGTINGSLKNRFFYTMPPFLRWHIPPNESKHNVFDKTY